MLSPKEKMLLLNFKKSEMGYYIPSWILIVVISSIFIKNVLFCFNRIEITWTLNSSQGKNLSQYLPIEV